MICDGLLQGIDQGRGARTFGSGAMHTCLYRVNALFTVASTTLAVICAATALTDWSYTPNPSVDLKIKSFDGLQVSNLHYLVTMLPDVQSLQTDKEPLVGPLWQADSHPALQREYGQDRAWLTLALEADLQSVFHWNTKQVPPDQPGHALV